MAEKHYVYVLKSKVDGRLYKGMTQNLELRLSQHNGGKVKSTKGYMPWVLVYHEIFETRQEARSREKYLKSAAGREVLKDILAA
ncbi:GIY-YIG nuclease family protein [Sediminicola luteus]|uniref:Endonuclease n=1 Tax=Sediminicola luteus TaxID=319238 RepID=A0A2A4G5W6_9FLAO|nr:GIY-YIG nuclease family protein [Sediminicola luteus]PCE63380.1 endonuclease [Sediminicola luteus]